jgi:hypothetical protein
VTIRPNHGCHEYRISRNSVLRVLRCRLVPQRPNQQGLDNRLISGPPVIKMTSACDTLRGSAVCSTSMSWRRDHQVAAETEHYAVGKEQTCPHSRRHRRARSRVSHVTAREGGPFTLVLTKTRGIVRSVTPRNMRARAVISNDSQRQPACSEVRGLSGPQGAQTLSPRTEPRAKPERPLHSSLHNFRYGRPTSRNH